MQCDGQRGWLLAPLILLACGAPSAGDSASPSVELGYAGVEWAGGCDIDQPVHGEPTSYELLVRVASDGEKARVVAWPDEGYYAGVADTELVPGADGALSIEAFFSIEIGYNGSNWTLVLAGVEEEGTWSGTCSTTTPGSYGIWGAPVGEGAFELLQE